MDLCGHRGFAGPSACVLEEGHSGKHQYGDIGTAYEVEMRKDAERYRWLRQYGNQEWERVFDEACRNMLEGAALDRAIDAALDETPNVQSHRDAQGSSRGSGGLAGSTTRGRE